MFVQILLGRKLARFEGALTDWQIADYGPVINTVVRDMGGLDAIGLQMVRDEWKYQREVQGVVIEPIGGRRKTKFGTVREHSPDR